MRVRRTKEDCGPSSAAKLKSAAIDKQAHRQRQNRDGNMDEDVISVLSSIAGNVLLFLLVFGMSATVETSHMREELRNTKAIMSGLISQFVFLPLLGFLVVFFMQPDHAVGITLLVITSSPGGSYSNWWCSLFNADLALSVTMTAISTVVSCVMLPANLLLYTHFSFEDDVVSKLDWKSLFVALFVVISAISVGLYCSYAFKSKTFHQRCNALGNLAGLALIVFSATVSSTGDAGSKIWSRDWTFYVAVALPCFFGLLIANLIASTIRLKPPERVTVAIECCYQNVGIATSLALTMFDGDELSEAMGVPVVYGMAEVFFIGIYCVVAWKSGWTKAPADESIFKVLFTSYELESEEEDSGAAKDSIKDQEATAVLSSSSLEMESP